MLWNTAAFEIAAAAEDFFLRLTQLAGIMQLLVKPRLSLRTDKLNA